MLYPLNSLLTPLALLACVALSTLTLAPFALAQEEADPTPQVAAQPLSLLPLSLTGAVTQQNTVTVPTAPPEAPFAFENTLMARLQHSFGNAGGFFGPHYDFAKLRLVYVEPADISFCDPKHFEPNASAYKLATKLNTNPQRPKRHVLQVDLKFNYEDVRGMKRIPLPTTNRELECQLVSYAQQGKLRGRLAKEFLLYQPTSNVASLNLFAPGNSDGAWLKVLQGLLGIGRDLGVISTTVGTVR